MVRTFLARLSLIPHRVAPFYVGFGRWYGWVARRQWRSTVGVLYAVIWGRRG
jgi:hypothetical protein